MQRPRVANQNIADLQRYGLHGNLADRKGAQGTGPGHSMRAGRDFDRAVLLLDRLQAKTHHDRIYGERQIGKFGKDRTLIVYVRTLILRSANRHIASPLVGDDAVVHEATDDTQHIWIEEELWCKTWWIERHREKMAVRAPVRNRRAVQVCKQPWPKRIAAGLNQRARKLLSQDAIPSILKLTDRTLNRFGGQHSIIMPSNRYRW